MKLLELELLLYSVNTQTPPIIFIRKVFAYLRRNQTLLKNADYYKLYNECLDFIKWFSIKNQDVSSDDNIDGLFETIADVFNSSQPEYACSSACVETYLKFRKDAWTVQ